jgi:hypothetical protein
LSPLQILAQRLGDEVLHQAIFLHAVKPHALPELARTPRGQLDERFARRLDLASLAHDWRVAL